MAKVPMEMGGGTSVLLQGNPTYITGNITVTKNNGVGCLMGKAISPLPRSQWISLLATGVTLSAEYRPIVDTNQIFYDANNDGYVALGVNADGTIKAFSYISNPSNNHNLSIASMCYVLKN